MFWQKLNFKLKNIYLYFLLISFLYFSLLPLNFLFAQTVPKVPVIDAGTISQLMNLNNKVYDLNAQQKQTLKLIQQTNDFLSGIFDQQVKNDASNLAVDLLKETTFLESTLDVEKFVSLNTIKNDGIIDGDFNNSTSSEGNYGFYLNEARHVGALESLYELSDNFRCFDPEIRYLITEYVVDDIYKNFSLATSAKDYFAKVPNCDEMSSSLLTSLQIKTPDYFLAKILKPFGLSSLAQVAGPISGAFEDEYSTGSMRGTFESVTINAAQQETINNLNLIQIKKTFHDYISSKIFQKENEIITLLGRKGDIRPILTCDSFKVLDDGWVLCSKYSVILDTKTVAKTKESTIQNTLSQTVNRPDIFVSFSRFANSLKKLGLTSNSFVAETKKIESKVNEFLGSDNIFLTSLGYEDYEDLINKQCAGYKEGTSANNAYARCLLNFNKVISKLVDSRINAFKEVNYKKKELIKKINEIEGRITGLDFSEHCQGAKNDLGNIKNYLEKTKVRLNDLEKFIRDEISGLVFGEKGLDSIIDDFDILRDITDMNEEIKNFLGPTSEFLSMFQDIASIADVSNYVPLAAIGFLTSAFEKMINILDEIENIIHPDTLTDIIERIENKIKKFAQEIITDILEPLSKLGLNLFFGNLSKADFLMIQYNLDFIEKKLEFYENIHTRGDVKCLESSESTSANINKNQFMANQLIRVEKGSLNNYSKGFWAKLQGLFSFQPKVVEVNFKR